MIITITGSIIEFRISFFECFVVLSIDCPQGHIVQTVKNGKILSLSDFIMYGNIFKMLDRCNWCLDALRGK